MSPTHCFYESGSTGVGVPVGMGAGEVYPGSGMRGGLGGAIPGTHQDPPRTPY